MFIYNELYQKNNNVWGTDVNPLIKKCLQYIQPGSTGLDLGCGQGKETFFLSQKGFLMTAVDLSEVSIKQMKNKILKQNIKNIKLEQANICNYRIKEKEYDFIICLNCLNFLDQKNIRKVIHEIKNKLNRNGIVILSCFTDKDPSFKSNKKVFKYYFKENEILSMFKDFKCLDYFEGEITDYGHVGKEKQHQHYIVSIIVQKYG